MRNFDWWHSKYNSRHAGIWITFFLFKRNKTIRYFYWRFYATQISLFYEWIINLWQKTMTTERFCKDLVKYFSMTCTCKNGLFVSLEYTRKIRSYFLRNFDRWYLKYKSRYAGIGNIFPPCFLNISQNIFDNESLKFKRYSILCFQSQ